MSSLYLSPSEASLFCVTPVLTRSPGIGYERKYELTTALFDSDLEEMHMSPAIRKLGDVCTYCSVGAIVALSVVTAAVLIWVFTLG